MAYLIQAKRNEQHMRWHAEYRAGPSHARLIYGPARTTLREALFNAMSVKRLSSARAWLVYETSSKDRQAWPV